MNRDQIISEYLNIVKESRSTKTHQTYGESLTFFKRVIGDADLTVDTYINFLRRTKDINPLSQALYRSALSGLYIYCASRQYGQINLAAIKEADMRYAKRRKPRFPEFDRPGIEKVITYCQTLQHSLLDLRDRAFVLTMADSGLRISEACGLRRGDIDWTARRSIIIGKGDKQAVVRYTLRAISALKDYLAARAQLDGGTGKPLNSLPLFARHDPGAGDKKVKSVGDDGMRKAIKQRITEAGIEDHLSIRIHDLRHYFVTVYYERSQDLKAAQEAARHSNVQITSRYTHLIHSTADELYDQIMNV